MLMLCITMLGFQSIQAENGLEPLPFVFCWNVDASEFEGIDDATIVTICVSVSSNIVFNPELLSEVETVVSMAASQTALASDYLLLETTHEIFVEKFNAVMHIPAGKHPVVNKQIIFNNVKFKTQ